ncbi:hypothetical protein K466DRAFT_665077 [Polyporus arcularius HHB13444]|uniref:BTB domain-containing protein n=1 Tax=Polyporus arcularius HHB13444 TaxID=1314778 RepID=A0A5C3P6Q4_9APHY|nr:hypothetical protein K466DRAFT_665077 [Polyporus arcularius HHB13444]
MADDAVRAPFDYPDWDVALRSSDGVLFRLHKMILGKASPVFEGMFALPADPAAPGQLQIVDMTEDADTLEHLLRIIYPVPPPTITAVPELVSLLETMKKCQMQDFVTALEQQMMGLLQSDTLQPLRAYTLAYIHKMKRLARAAARRLLLYPHSLEPDSMPPEYIDIPASATWLLVEYRQDCRKVAEAAVDDALWMATRSSGRKPVWISHKGRVMDVSGSWAWVTCSDPAHPASNVDLGRQNSQLLVCDWWKEYNAAAKEALKSCPSGEVVMRSGVLRPAVKKAATCGQCSGKAWEELVDYSQLLAKRIDDVTSLVQIKLPF